MERLQVAELDLRLDVAAAHADALGAIASGDTSRIDDHARLAHEVAHVAEQLDVRAVVALVHQPGLREHLGEDRVLVDRAVLHRRAPAPDDLLVLLEPAVEQIHLHRERVARGVAIEVREVLVVGDRLVVACRCRGAVPSAVGERRLAGADHPGDADEDVAEHVGRAAVRLASSLGDGRTVGGRGFVSAAGSRRAMTSRAPPTVPDGRWHGRRTACRPL